jgi:hypothetical protein
LLAGRAAPGLGGTSAGKAQFELLFQLSAGCVILGALGCAVVATRRLFGPAQG